MLGWYFAPENRKLRHGDGRLVEAGITHTVDCKPELCMSGLHWSEKAIDALGYAPGPIACRVEGGGKVVEGDDKIVGTSRKYLALADATDVLRRLTRKWALDVIQLWDAPQVVKDYLETGDEELRRPTLTASEAMASSAWTTHAEAWTTEAWTTGLTAWNAARATMYAATSAARAADAALAANTSRVASASRAAEARAAFNAYAEELAASEAILTADIVRDQQNKELETALYDLLRC